MSTHQKVMEALGRAVEAHKRAHHDDVRALRKARAALDRQVPYDQIADEDVAELAPQGLPAPPPRTDPLEGL